MKFSLIDRTAEFDPKDIADAKGVSGLSYLWVLFFLPLVAKPTSKFGRFHANQGLLVLIAQMLANIVIFLLRNVLGWIPFSLFGLLGSILSVVFNILFIGVVIFWLVTALTGKAYELPFVGGIQILK